MEIDNNREEPDSCSLYKQFWSGVTAGKDGYPEHDKDGYYYIAGIEKYHIFEAKAIEFYGVKT